MNNAKTRVHPALMVCAACVVVLCGPAILKAQGDTKQSVPLGDVARQNRQKQGEQPKKAVKVITNDDIPSHPPDASSKTEKLASSPAQSDETGAKPASDSTASGSDASDSGPHDEAYFRKTMEKLRGKAKADKARLVELCQEIDQHERDIPPDYMLVGGMHNEACGGKQTNVPVLESGGSVPLKSYRVNPEWAANPVRAEKEWRAEEKELASLIASQQDEIADDEKAISDFVEQCRRESCKPEWIRQLEN